METHSRLALQPSRTIRRRSRAFGYPLVDGWVNEATAEFFRRFCDKVVNLEAFGRLVREDLTSSRREALRLLNHPPGGVITIAKSVPGYDCLDVQAILSALTEEVDSRHKASLSAKATRQATES